MWDEVYTWLEEHSGNAYDLRDDIDAVSGDAIFISPHEWHSNIHYVLDKLSDALDVVDENWKHLTEDLPNRTDLKKLITTDVLSGLVKIIDSIEQKLNIDPVDINNVDTLYVVIETLFDIVEEMTTHSIEQILKTDWFEDYNNENDDILSVKMGIHKNDLTNMHYTIQSIVDLHEDDDE